MHSIYLPGSVAADGKEKTQGVFTKARAKAKQRLLVILALLVQLNDPLVFDAHLQSSELRGQP